MSHVTMSERIDMNHEGSQVAHEPAQVNGVFGAAREFTSREAASIPVYAILAGASLVLEAAVDGVELMADKLAAWVHPTAE